LTKRLVCPKCATLKKVDKDKWIFQKKGIALQDYTCNLCFKTIRKGELCYAETIGTKSRRYKQWEYIYIEVII